jgi:hypothetical protein
VSRRLASTEPVPAAQLEPSSASLVARLLTALAIIATMLGAGAVALDWEPRLLPIRIVTVDGRNARSVTGVAAADRRSSTSTAAS